MPCSNCVRRGRIELCSEAMANSTSSRFVCLSPSRTLLKLNRYSGETSLDLTQEQEDGHLLQRQLSVELFHEIPAAYPAFSHQQPQPQHQAQIPQDQLQGRAMESSTRSEDHHGQLAASSAPVRPFTTHSTPSRGSRPAIPGRITGTLHSNTSGIRGSSNPDSQTIDNYHQNGSHGTLMLDKEGRSKYLGPTAGSEWLKDVSH